MTDSTFFNYRYLNLAALMPGSANILNTCFLFCPLYDRFGTQTSQVFLESGATHTPPEQPIEAIVDPVPDYAYYRQGQQNSQQVLVSKSQARQPFTDQRWLQRAWHPTEKT
jgi:hypothetical protein